MTPDLSIDNKQMPMSVHFLNWRPGLDEIDDNTRVFIDDLKSLVRPREETSPRPWDSRTTYGCPEKPIYSFERIIAGWDGCPKITYQDKGGAQQGGPTIRIPHAWRFPSIEVYYLILGHEMTHATGSIGNLYRNSRHGFDPDDPVSDPTFLLEEGIAEFGGYLLCCHAGFGDKVVDGSALHISRALGRIGDFGYFGLMAISAAISTNFILRNEPHRPEYLTKTFRK